MLGYWKSKIKRLVPETIETVYGYKDKIHVLYAQNTRLRKSRNQILPSSKARKYSNSTPKKLTKLLTQILRKIV
jgi:hypothetical protein